jgi:mRNA interferase MazF
VEDDRFDTESVTSGPCTTDPTDAPLFRIEIVPSGINGLHDPCRLMVDKITTVRRSRTGAKVGELGASGPCPGAKNGQRSLRRSIDRLHSFR